MIRILRRLPLQSNSWCIQLVKITAHRNNSYECRSLQVLQREEEKRTWGNYNLFFNREGRRAREFLWLTIKSQVLQRVSIDNSFLVLVTNMATFRANHGHLTCLKVVKILQTSRKWWFVHNVTMIQAETRVVYRRTHRRMAIHTTDHPSIWAIRHHGSRATTRIPSWV